MGVYGPPKNPQPGQKAGAGGATKGKQVQPGSKKAGLQRGLPK